MNVIPAHRFFFLITHLLTCIAALLFPKSRDGATTAQSLIMGECSSSNPCSLEYTLMPVAGENGQLSALYIAIVISELVLKNQDLLFITPVEIAKVDVGRIENGLTAHDDKGPLELVHEVEAFGPPIVNQKWRVTRSTVGLIVVTYTALPRQVNSSTKNAPSFELRENQGGLLGSGFGFLVVPPPTGKSEVFRTTIKWDLSNLKDTNQAIWTWGEGPGPITKDLEPMDIAATYFMVGNIHSFTNGNFGVYWLKTPPFNTTELSQRMLQLYQNMSMFFRETEDTYRVFVRHNIFSGSKAGTALKRSFMFSFDDEDITHPRDVDDYLLFLAHECIHNWLHLSDGLSENWYSEGMAEYYSVFLSHRAGLLSNDGFRIELNKRLTSHYTNPLINLSNDEVAKLTWKLSDAQRIPYGRGFVFILKISSLISTSSGGDGGVSIDTLVLDLLERSRTGKPFGITEFIRGLGSMLNGGQSEAQALYDSMASGSQVIPPTESLGKFGLKLIREDATVWELGFDEQQAMQGDRIIIDLVPGSAAAKSGLHEGDKILNPIRLDELKCNPHGTLDLVILRNGSEKIEFSFLPRGQSMVETWIYENRIGNQQGLVDEL